MLHFDDIILEFTNSSRKVSEIVCEGYVQYRSANEQDFRRIEYFAGYPTLIVVSMPIREFQKLSVARRASLVFTHPSMNITRVARPAAAIHGSEHSLELREAGYRP